MQNGRLRRIEVLHRVESGRWLLAGHMAITRRGKLGSAACRGQPDKPQSLLAQLLAEKDIRVNAVAPGPIWSRLIPSTLPAESAQNFGKQVPMQRPGQPVEVATSYIMLADPLSSYVSGAAIAVTGGRPFF
jgi:enoyl-[acyl-carrier-protein] reductase (NADH)